MAKKARRRREASTETGPAGSRRAPSSSEARPAKPGASSPERPSSSDVPAARLHVWQVQVVRDLLVVAAAVGLLWSPKLSIIANPTENLELFLQAGRAMHSNDARYSYRGINTRRTPP